MRQRREPYLVESFPPLRAVRHAPEALWDVPETDICVLRLQRVSRTSKHTNKRENCENLREGFCQTPMDLWWNSPPPEKPTKKTKQGKAVKC